MVMPTKYTTELGLEILELHATGESIRNIVKLDGMPSRSTLYGWRAKYPDFDALYLKAVESHVESLIDKARDGVENATEKEARITKVRTDFYLWLAGKLNSKYSDKLTIEQTVKLDISPALTLALARMAEVKPLIEAVTKQIE